MQVYPKLAQMGRSLGWIKCVNKKPSKKIYLTCLGLSWLFLTVCLERYLLLWEQTTRAATFTPTQWETTVRLFLYCTQHATWCNVNNTKISKYRQIIVLDFRINVINANQTKQLYDKVIINFLVKELKVKWNINEVELQFCVSIKLCGKRLLKRCLLVRLKCFFSVLLNICSNVL